jgi:hypothetical protein
MSDSNGAAELPWHPLLDYSTPKLKEYGTVGTLTQAGTGLSSEVMANGMASMSPNQRA